MMIELPRCAWAPSWTPRGPHAWTSKESVSRTRRLPSLVEQARGEDRGEEREVEVPDPVDAEAGRTDSRDQLFAPVAPDVVGDVVLGAPEELEGRDHDEQLAPGSERVRDLAQGRGVVLEVL